MIQRCMVSFNLVEDLVFGVATANEVTYSLKAADVP
jgi:hypothetical protein